MRENWFDGKTSHPHLNETPGNGHKEKKAEHHQGLARRLVHECEWAQTAWRLPHVSYYKEHHTPHTCGLCFATCSEALVPKWGQQILWQKLFPQMPACPPGNTFHKGDWSWEGTEPTAPRPLAHPCSHWGSQVSTSIPGPFPSGCLFQARRSCLHRAGGDRGRAGVGGAGTRAGHLSILHSSLAKNRPESSTYLSLAACGTGAAQEPPAFLLSWSCQLSPVLSQPPTQRLPHHSSLPPSNASRTSTPLGRPSVFSISGHSPASYSPPPQPPPLGHSGRVSGPLPHRLASCLCPATLPPTCYLNKSVLIHLSGCLIHSKTGNRMWCDTLEQKSRISGKPGKSQINLKLVVMYQC